METKTTQSDSSTNYVHVVENSQSYTTIEQILWALERLNNPPKYDENVIQGDISHNNLDYIIIGIKNTIKNEYKLVQSI